MNFNIIKWLALCPSETDQHGWSALAENQPLCLGVLNQPPVDLIPAMLRRRMSSLSKLAVQAATQVSVGENVDYIVFASRHGELTRTVKLIEDILAGHDASPIMFSQSVHNTAAGLFTISTKKALPVCSLAAGENTLHAAIIEANGYLQENPDHQVLVVNFDEPLPEPYCVFEEQSYQGMALALLLSAGETFHVSSKTSTQSGENPNPQAFACIDFLLNDSHSASITGKKTTWLWERK